MSRQSFLSPSSVQVAVATVVRLACWRHLAGTVEEEPASAVAASCLLSFIVGMNYIEALAALVSDAKALVEKVAINHIGTVWATDQITCRSD